jgi:hypothetical protein
MHSTINDLYKKLFETYSISFIRNKEFNKVLDYDILDEFNIIDVGYGSRTIVFDSKIDRDFFLEVF